jgi:hypothetical protein
MGGTALAAEPDTPVSGLLHLQSSSALAGPALFAAQEETTMTTSSTSSGGGYTLGGPYFLRSADPEAPGVMEFKFIYGWETSSSGSDDHEVAFEFEWGLVENVEFILEAAATVGDGRVEGNGDIEEIGFHTRFWEENGWLPAFAMRNLVRLPTGYHSSGVDYTAIGLFTWTLDPGATRLHFNPFLKSVNGDNGEDDDDGFWGWRRFGPFGDSGDDGGERDFQWGAALGVDHRVSDDLLIIFDYKHTSSEDEGARNNHSLEFGGEWEVAPHREIGFATEIGLDGDDNGPNFAARISYIIEVG